MGVVFAILCFGSSRASGRLSGGAVLTPFWHDRCFEVGPWRRPKHEYPRVYQRVVLENDRTEAWQDVLGGFGLRSSPLSAKPRLDWRTCHRAVSCLARRRRTDAFCRRPAGVLALAAAGRSADPADPGRGRRRAQGRRFAADGPSGRLLLLPRQNDWRVTFHRDMRAIVLSVTAESFGGRKISLPECRDADHRRAGRHWPTYSAAPWRQPPKRWKSCRPRPGTRSGSASPKCC